MAEEELDRVRSGASGPGLIRLLVRMGFDQRSPCRASRSVNRDLIVRHVDRRLQRTSRVEYGRE